MDLTRPCLSGNQSKLVVEKRKTTNKMEAVERLQWRSMVAGEK
jgi:hypothetical protein